MSVHHGKVQRSICITGGRNPSRKEITSTHFIISIIRFMNVQGEVSKILTSISSSLSSSSASSSPCSFFSSFPLAQIRDLRKRRVHIPTKYTPRPSEVKTCCMSKVTIRNVLKNKWIKYQSVFNCRWVRKRMKAISWQLSEGAGEILAWGKIGLAN